MPSEIQEEFDIFTNGVYLIGTTIGIGAVFFSSRISIWKEIHTLEGVEFMKQDVQRFLIYFFIWLGIILFFMYHRFGSRGILYALGIGLIFFVWFVGNAYSILINTERRIKKAQKKDHKKESSEEGS